MSASNPTLELIDPDTERLACETFARTAAAPAYRDMLSHLYATWHDLNARFFDGRLRVPHIGIGRTTPRRFSECRLTTNYGGAIDITIRDSLAFGTDERLIRQPWPAEGTRRFLDDLLLGETVKQFVLEVRGATEDGYGGYGPLYAQEATRIGESLGLPPVVARRRGFRGRGLPVAAFWPWAFRPDGYYLGDVRLDHRQVAGLRPARGSGRHDVVPGVFEYFLYLLVTNRVDRLTRILGRHVDARTESQSPAVAAFERSPHDPTGRPLPVPQIEPDWMAWNMGCVPAIAAGIRARRAFHVLPILADALQDAGCEDETLLGHCRADAAHTGNCWALRLLERASPS